MLKSCNHMDTVVFYCDWSVASVSPLLELDTINFIETSSIGTLTLNYITRAGNIYRIVAYTYDALACYSK